MEDKLYSAFQRRKIKRYLEVHGEAFTFLRYGLDAYNQPTKEAQAEITHVGVFYTQNNQKGFWLINEFQEGRVRYKRYLTNFIIVSYEAFALNPIRLDDQVIVNGKPYRVTGATNVQEANFAVNISLDAMLTEIAQEGANA